MSNVKTYSLKKDGSTQLSKNFRVREFRCKDGSDAIKVCLDLVKILQRVRDKFGKAITITSAYRTTSHNKKVGGASNSQHLRGTAADIVVSGVKPAEVAKYLESIGAKGIGLYSSFTHVDTRSSKYYWNQTSGTAKTVSTFGGAKASAPKPTLRKGSKGAEVKKLQQMLKVTADGIFGDKTESALKAWQKKHGLVADGIYGVKSEAKAKSL